jgi:hypothetical protein
MTTPGIRLPPRARVHGLASYVLLVLGVACGGDDRASPSAPSALPPRPAPVLSGLRIEGLEQMAPGTDAILKAWARFSDGTETDVTDKVQLTEITVGCFECVTPPILRIGEGGRIHAVAAGEAGLRAYYRQEPYEAIDEHHRILVLPAGTFRLTGRISESDSGGQPVANVFVRVDSDAGRIEQYATPNGEYRAFGVRGVTRVTATSENHHPVQHRLVVEAHSEVNLEARPIIVRADEAAAIVLRAASDCAPAGAEGALPEAARHRRYTATLTTARDGRVFVRLTGAHFATFPLEGGGTGGNAFIGNRTSNGFSFGIRGYYNTLDEFSYPDILEQLSETQFLTFQGTTTIAGAGSRLSGPFAGTLAVYPGDIRPGGGEWWRSREPTASCTSAGHEFTLEQR